MYRQFCKNLNNFITINKSESDQENLRLKNAIEILPLANVEDFIKFKETDKIKYKRIGNFIFELSKYIKKYPSLEKFIWELWAYGFDIIQIEKNELYQDEFLDEKVKIIDLMLSTHFF
jgi:hypothetical protein